MKELFLGMMLVFLDVKIGIGQFTADILPDFVGWYLMLPGLAKLGSQSVHFRKSRPLVLVMVIGTAVLYVMELSAGTLSSKVLNFFLGAAALIISLLVGYRIVSGIRDLERRQNRDLEGEKLQNLWLYTAVIHGIAYACGWIPMVGTMGSVAALVMSVCFLTAFYRTQDLYESKA